MDKTVVVLLEERYKHSIPANPSLQKVKVHDTEQRRPVVNDLSLHYGDPPASAAPRLEISGAPSDPRLNAALDSVEPALTPQHPGRGCGVARRGLRGGGYGDVSSLAVRRRCRTA